MQLVRNLLILLGFRYEINDLPFPKAEVRVKGRLLQLLRLATSRTDSVSAAALELLSASEAISHVGKGRSFFHMTKNTFVRTYRQPAENLHCGLEGVNWQFACQLYVQASQVLPVNTVGQYCPFYTIQVCCSVLFSQKFPAPGCYYAGQKDSMPPYLSGCTRRANPLYRICAITVLCGSRGIPSSRGYQVNYPRATYPWVKYPWVVHSKGAG